jgi:CheY-like chemotaxis protein
METKRVIIVDDEMVLGQLLQAAFATLGGSIEVAVVPSAEQASGEISEKDIHLLVCDVKLPGISGLDFTRELKGKLPGLRIILVSGVNDPQIKEKSISAGADAFFPKPVEMREFLETASRLLGINTQTHPLTFSDSIDLRSDLIIDTLIDLRQELAAQAVTMMQFDGNIIASAGDFPDDGFSSNALPYLLSAITNLQRMNTEMAIEKPENLFSMRGNQYDLLISSLNAGYLLMVVMKKSKSPVRLAIAFDAISMSLADLQAKITQSAKPSEVFGAGVLEIVTTEETIIKEKTEQVPESPEKEIEVLFIKGAKKKLKAEEVDNFWEEATSKPTFSDTVGPGLLSYEQASKLGLTPEEEKKHK